MSAAERRADSGKFRQTDWSLIGRAGQGGTDGRREALEVLLLRYLPAMRAHLVRRKGFSPDEADDLVQEFVTSKILERDLIARASRDEGKFRTFLLTAMNRFVYNRIRDQQAKRRSPEHGRVVSMGDYLEHPEVAEQAADEFHAVWAEEVISQALLRMKTQCERSGRSDMWGVFQDRIVGPTLEGTKPVGYGELIERFGFGSPAQASNALITAKRMYARILRTVLAEYTRDDQEINEEIDELKGILSRCGSS